MDDLFRRREERSRHYMGKLRANAAGTEYVLYDSGKSPKDLGLGWDDGEAKENDDLSADSRSSLRKELCVVSYSQPSKRDKDARTMEIAVPKVKGVDGDGAVEVSVLISRCYPRNSSHPNPLQIWQPLSARDAMPAHFARIRYQKAHNVLLGKRLFCGHLKER